MSAKPNDFTDKIHVSVIIPNYNYAHYLGQCLQSAMDSDFDPTEMEIIVVDDASTDDSVKVIEEMRNSSRFQIRLLKNEINIGVIRSRNRGIVNALGEFLFFLDSDNYIRKDCLKIHATVLQQDPDAIACYAPNKEFLDNTSEYFGLRSNHSFDYLKLCEGNYIDAMAMYRKKDLTEAGMYDNNMPPYGWEDYELWLRLGKLNKQVIFINCEPLSFYRIHQSNKSRNRKPDQYNHLVYYLKQKYPLNIPLNQTETIVNLIHQKKYVAQLFYTTDDADFREQNSILVEITENPFHLKLPAGKNITALRFDPLNNYAVVKIKGIWFFNTGNEIFINPKIKSNAVADENSTYFFSTTDPQITIEFDVPLLMDEVVIDIDYLKIGGEVIDELDKIIQFRIEKINAQPSEKSEEMGKMAKDMNQIMQSTPNEIDRFPNQNTNIKDELAAIKSSHSYKTGKRLTLIHPFQFALRLKEKISLRKNLRMIKESGLFDEEYYLENNTDVKGSGGDAARHYLLSGGFEGRNPSAKFDSTFYLEQNPDVKSSGMNPLIHFIKYGANEGRQPAKPISATIDKNPVDNEKYDEHTLNLPVKIVVKNPKKLQSFVLENDGKTEFINRYFNRIYVINLRRRQNKLVEIVQKLKRLNISAEIIEAVDGYQSPHIDEYEMYKAIPLLLENAHPKEKELKRKLIYSPGVWGHLKSNRLILKDALAKRYEKILILEDDVMFMKNFHQEFEKFTGTINGKNWSFLYLGATQAFWDIPGSVFYPDKSLSTYQSDQPFYHPVSTFGSFALAIHQSQFNNIIDKIDEMNCPFDWIYTLSFNQLADKCYVAQPNLIIADMAESDNRPKEESLHDKMLAIQRRKWDLSKYE